MSVRFKRSIEVTLASQLDPDKRKSNGRFFNAFTKRTTIKNLRVRFSIGKTSSKDPNSARILITNLAPGTRAEFQTKPAHITLSAGYDGANKVLYKGDIKDAESYREGPDWVTEVTCGTGFNARNARATFSFGGGTSKRDMMSKLIQSMGLTVPTNVQEGKDFIEQLSSGKAIQGPSLAQVQKIAGPRFRVSVQDDKMVVLNVDGVRSATGVRIAQDTGMIGIPILGAPQHDGGKPVLNVKTLLNPDLKVGGFAQLRTNTVNGDYHIHRVLHNGDTHGQEWYSSVEGTAL